MVFIFKDYNKKVGYSVSIRHTLFEVVDKNVRIFKITQLYFSGYDVHVYTNDNVGPRQRVAQLCRHQIHGGCSVTQLAENYENYHRYTMYFSICTI